MCLWPDLGSRCSQISTWAVAGRWRQSPRRSRVYAVWHRWAAVWFPPQNSCTFLRRSCVNVCCCQRICFPPKCSALLSTEYTVLKHIVCHEREKHIFKFHLQDDAPVLESNWRRRNSLSSQWRCCRTSRSGPQTPSNHHLWRVSLLSSGTLLILQWEQNRYARLVEKLERKFQQLGDGMMFLADLAVQWSVYHCNLRLSPWPNPVSGSCWSRGMEFQFGGVVTQLTLIHSFMQRAAHYFCRILRNLWILFCGLPTNSPNWKLQSDFSSVWRKSFHDCDGSHWNFPNVIKFCTNPGVRFLTNIWTNLVKSPEVPLL